MPDKIRMVWAMSGNSDGTIRFPYVDDVLGSKALKIYDAGTSNPGKFSGQTLSVNPRYIIPARIDTQLDLHDPRGYPVDVKADATGGPIDIGTFLFYTYRSIRPRINQSVRTPIHLADDGSGICKGGTDIICTSPFASIGSPVRISSLIVSPVCQEIISTATQASRTVLHVEFQFPFDSMRRIRSLAAYAINLSMTVLSDSTYNDEMDMIEPLEIIFDPPP